MIGRKVWEEYPELWKTEAEWWSFLRGCLRRGLWEKSPIKLKFKNENCSKPPEDYTGRAKSGTYCALTGEWTGKSALEVDHVEGHVSLLSWEDVIPFINHLVPEKGSLQLVSKEAHKVKSYSERMGIDFEEALLTKLVIDLEKKKMLSDFIESKGHVPKSNSKLRREQAIQLLKEEKENVE